MKEEKFINKMMLESLNSLLKKADSLFQKMRRMQEANPSNGIVRCISCGSIGHYKSFDSGHFIPRQHKGTRYSSMNVWPQCKKCNRWLSGNHSLYRDNLVKKIGLPFVEIMERDKDVMPEGITWREWLIEIIISSNRKIKDLSKILA